MNRTYIYYEFKALEPLIVANHSQIGNLITVHDYIPGNTILGLFASLFLNAGYPVYDNKQKYHGKFKTLFLSNEVLFLNAYPLHQKTNCPSMPMPMSVFGCKYYGRNTFNSKEEEHGIFDMTFKKIPEVYECKQCKSVSMKHKDGYLYYYEGNLYDLKIPKRIDTKVNVDGEKLYSTEAIEKDTIFYSCLAINSKIFQEYFDLLRSIIFPDSTERAHSPINLRLGKGRNRGYGAIEFIKFENCPFPFEMESQKNPNQLSVYCYEDIILKNEMGQHYTYLSPEFILGSHEEEYLSLVSNLSYWDNDTASGFNTQRKMPLNRELIIKKGSVFVYDIKKQLPSDLPLFIGKHQNRGYGRLIYNHPYLKEK